jgi:SOS-response transcriptional repressor LexA
MKEQMNKTERYFYCITAVILITIVSYNAVRTKTVEVTNTEIVEIEVIKEVEVEKMVSECKTFDEAFKVHREFFGKHGTFFWNGKEYHLYFREEI